MNSLKRVKIALLVVPITITAHALSFSPAAEAKNFWNQDMALAKRSAKVADKKTELAAKPQQTSLIRLKKSDSLWTVLEDFEVKELMKETMGADLEKYFSSTQLTELPDVKGEDLYATGGVRGLFTITESFFDVNLNTKKVCVCVLNEGVISVWGADSFQTLPEPVREYIEDVQSRIKQDAVGQKQGPGAKVCFEKPKHEPVHTADSKSKQGKHMNLSNVTGSYSRVDTEPRLEGADFRVVKLPGNKINFSCNALSGAHTGGASGVVAMQKDTAIYDCDFGEPYGYRLRMRFDGKFVYIEQEGDGFGGIGVTASGTYQKMDDQTPQILQN